MEIWTGTSGLWHKHLLGLQGKEVDPQRSSTPSKQWTQQNLTQVSKSYFWNTSHTQGGPKFINTSKIQ